MEKRQIARIVTWSTVALIVPILGQLFIDGWNWGPGDFAFAWIFFSVLGCTYTFVTNKVQHRGGRFVAGLLVIAFFVTIWVILATG